MEQAHQFPIISEDLNFLPSTYWTAIDVDFDTKFIQASVTSLVDLCCETLIIDVCLLRKVVHRLPAPLFVLILEKAIEKGKVLSITHLMKYFPRDTFLFPVPAVTRSWAFFFTDKRDLKFLPNFHSTKVVLQSFLEKISKEQNSSLQFLDMNEPPVVLSDYTQYLKKFFEMKECPQHMYTLKINLITILEDLQILIRVKCDRLIKSFFNLIVTGLYVCHDYCSSKKLYEVLSLLKDDELLHFTMDFYEPSYDCVYAELKRFVYLKTLSLTYIGGFARDPELLENVAEVLNYLHHLTQINLRGTTLTGILQKLLRHNCTKKYSSVENATIKNLNCCLTHRGKLKFLDVSACGLTDRDLLSLWEFSVTKSLKYLNLGLNVFDITKLLKTLEAIGSSVVVLDVENCFYSISGMHHLLSKLEFLPKLRSINMKGLLIAIEDLNFLFHIVKNIPELSQVVVSEPYDADDFLLPSFISNYTRHMASENSVNISFHKSVFL